MDIGRTNPTTLSFALTKNRAKRRRMVLAENHIGGYMAGACFDVEPDSVSWRRLTHSGGDCCMSHTTTDMVAARAGVKFST
jgi:hypothetical protein